MFKISRKLSEEPCSRKRLGRAGQEFPGTMSQLGHGQVFPVFFPFGGSVFLRFLAGGHFSEIIFVPQQKKTGVGNITLHMFSSKSSANCDLDEIKLVVLLSSLFFF